VGVLTFDGVITKNVGELATGVEVCAGAAEAGGKAEPGRAARIVAELNARGVTVAEPARVAGTGKTAGREDFWAIWFITSRTIAMAPNTEPAMICQRALSTYFERRR
jgi:lambda repressor-like predicted transcriptional regulator